MKTSIDVFTRGSKHSMHHKTLDVESKEFWNFSFHEIGYYDLPAMIDYMLKSTNQSKFFCVAYSQGTSATMVMLTKRPEYNQKIIQTHFIAPAVFLKHMKSPGIKFIDKPNIKQLIKDLGLFKNPPIMGLISAFSSNVCKEPTFSICQSVFFYICGQTTGEIEMNAVSVITSIV